MAEAEDEALAASGGVLACSPEIYRMMVAEAEKERTTVIVDVPPDVVKDLRKG
jgi:hypothetical protein